MTHLPRVTTWEEWGRLFTDVPTWTAAVHEIGRRLGLPVMNIAPGYPGTNAVFIVNTRAIAEAERTLQPYVVKIYCPFCHEDFTLEQVLHPLLARYPGLPVPVSLGYGVLEGEMDWPYLVLSFIEGDAIRDARSGIPHSSLVALARDLGRCVAILHDIPRSSFLSLASCLGDWGLVAEQQLAKTLDHLAGNQVLPIELIRRIPDFVKPVLAGQSPSSLVLVNGDLTEDHVLLAEEDGTWRISGLIDFADSLLAPRDYEWVALWFGALDRDPGCLHAFMEGYNGGIVVDAAFRRRAMAYTFLHEFGGLMIELALSRLGLPHIESLTHLETVLWPLC
jgi:hygromycin-B 7''-O-kinase